MRSWKLLVGASALAAFAAAALLSLPEPAGAKPPYLKLFKDTCVDKNDKASDLAKLNCAVCHTLDKGEKGKMKDWNKFGSDVGTILKEKKAKGLNADLLAEAVKLPSAVEGKSYADLIKDKKPPASK